MTLRSGLYINSEYQNNLTWKTWGEERHKFLKEIDFSEIPSVQADNFQPMVQSWEKW